MLKRPPRRNSKHESYDAYLAALKKTIDATPASPPAMANVIVAACSGSRRLSQRVGSRVALIATTDAPEEALDALRERRHGGGLLSGDRGELIIEAGWTDWSKIALTFDMTGGRPLQGGVAIENGMLRVNLGPPTAKADFERRLALSMDRQRYDEALTRPSAIKHRLMKSLPLSVPARFSVSDARDPMSWDRVRNIYVFDAWRDLQMLSLRIATAAMAEPTRSQLWTDEKNAAR